MARVISSLALMASLAAATAAEKVTITGTVRNEDGEGLVGAEIEVYAMVRGQLHQVAAAKSGQGGAYEVKVAGVDVISHISYEHPGWQPCLVCDVSARAGDDQVIHKVLPDRQGPERFLPILEQVHEYEVLYYFERELAGPGADDVTVRQATRRKYLKRILGMPDPLRYGPDPRPTPPADSRRDPQRDVISGMKPDEKAVLARKIGELFELYGIPRLGGLHLTQWETAYSAADGVPTRAVARIIMAPARTMCIATALWSGAESYPTSK